MIYYRKTLFGSGPKLTAVQIHTPEYLAMWEKTTAEFDEIDDQLERESKQAKNPKK